VLNDFTSIVYFILFALLLTYFSKNMIIVLGVPLILINLYHPKREGMENKDKNKDKLDDKLKINKLTDEKQKKAEAKQSTDDADAQPNEESFEVGRVKKGGYNIDYASTVESAYDDLNKILGSDGIKSLTDDTQKLMKQQMQLTESMKSIEPFIKNMAPMLQQAQGILGSMNNKDGLGNIMDMAKKLTGGNKQA
jgi:flagellum-specific peptidoglycan hydrolase FlgJ